MKVVRVTTPEGSQLFVFLQQTLILGHDSKKNLRFREEEEILRGREERKLFQSFCRLNHVFERFFSKSGDVGKLFHIFERTSFFDIGRFYRSDAFDLTKLLRSSFI